VAVLAGSGTMKMWVMNDHPKVPGHISIVINVTVMPENGDVDD